MRIADIPFIALLIVAFGNSSVSQTKSYHTSAWTDGRVRIEVACEDKYYSRTDTAQIIASIYNGTGKPIYVTRYFHDPWIQAGYPIPGVTFQCRLDFSFEWWFASDPLMNGIGPSVDAINDTATTVVKIPVSKYLQDLTRYDFLVDLCFAYIENLKGYEFLLDPKIAYPNKFGPKEIPEFDMRIINAQMNPIRLNIDVSHNSKQK